MFTVKKATNEDIIKRWEYLKNIYDNMDKWNQHKNDTLKFNRLVYYGYLDDEIICEASSIININDPLYDKDLVNNETAYLFDFRTNKEYQNKGYFSKVFDFMINDLKSKGYVNYTLGVEVNNEKNNMIYNHLGFNRLIKREINMYPNGDRLVIKYLKKSID